MTRLADVPEGYVDVPVPFEGPPEVKRANIASHAWIVDDPEEPPVCMDCDAKLGSRQSHYPCGTSAPRKLVRRDSPGFQSAMVAAIGIPAKYAGMTEEE